MRPSKGVIAVNNDEYDILEIANWFLNKERMSHKKLQKLCYYSVAWGYALLNRAICKRSEFQAWIHGPASPVIYDKFKGSAWTELNPINENKKSFDEVTEDLLESVWITYGNQTGNSLEALSHSELPWLNARKNCGEDERCSNTIDSKDMKEFYLSIYIGEEA